MDAKFQSSFIPKTSVVGPSYTHEKTSGFAKLATGVFILVILGIGGLFAYKKVVEGSIATLQTELATAENSVDKEAIKKLTTFDKKLRAAREVVNRHVAVSEYLSFLEKNTLSSMSYSSLSYNAIGAAQEIEVMLNGAAPSYAAIAQAENILRQNPHVAGVEFSDLKLGKGGSVNFSLKARLKNDLVKWSNVVKDTVASTTPSVSRVATSTQLVDEDLNMSDIEDLDMPDTPNF